MPTYGTHITAVHPHGHQMRPLSNFQTVHLNRGQAPS